MSTEKWKTGLCGDKTHTHTHTHTSDVGSVRSVEVFPMQLVVLENTHQSDADRKMETLRKNKKKR